METSVYILLCLGCGLIFLASLGCLKFPDTLTRMAAVSKSSTLGTIFLCAAGTLHFMDQGVTWMLGFTAGLLFLGIPIGSHLLGRARLHSNRGQALKALRNDYERDQKVLEEKALPSEGPPRVLTDRVLKNENVFDNSSL